MELLSGLCVMAIVVVWATSLYSVLKIVRGVEKSKASKATWGTGCSPEELGEFLRRMDSFKHRAWKMDELNSLKEDGRLTPEQFLELENMDEERRALRAAYWKIFGKKT